MRVVRVGLAYKEGRHPLAKKTGIKNTKREHFASHSIYWLVCKLVVKIAFLSRKEHSAINPSINIKRSVPAVINIHFVILNSSYKPYIFHISIEIFR